LVIILNIFNISGSCGTLIRPESSGLNHLLITLLYLMAICKQIKPVMPKMKILLFRKVEQVKAK